MTPTRVGIVGTGLIGTSIGMALLRRGVATPLLFDRDGAASATAAALGAGMAVAEDDLRGCDHIIIAVPPGVIAGTLLRYQRLNLQATFSDVGSIKSSVITEAEALNCDMARFCGAHPIAGRERGGPTAAVPELFDDAVWVSTPSAQTSSQARNDVRWIAEECGARSIEMSAAEHDRALAVVSHLPQLVASLLATQLSLAGSAGPTLAGRGFRDTTRLAESDPTLWVQIAMGNRAELSAALAAHAARAEQLIVALELADAPAVERLLTEARAARDLLPTKSRRVAVHWTRLAVVLQDQPGELARLFTVAGTAGVNIEDVSIDHATDHPVGLVALDVEASSAETLTEAVRSAGWHVLTID
jgi:prephenate dehydrogenase